MVPQSLRPVHQLAIIRAGRPLHLCVPLEWGLRVWFQHAPVLGFEFPAFALVHCPVFVNVIHRTRFIRVTPECPVPQHVVEEGVTSVEGFPCHHCAVVVGPASDNRVEIVDQFRLRGISAGSDDLAQFRRHAP